MKRKFWGLLALTFSLFLVSCKKDIVKDAPVFNNVIENKLSKLDILVGQDVDLLEGVTARNAADTKDAIVTISSLGGFSNTKVGQYTIKYLAVDENGLTAQIERIVEVKQVQEAK